MISLRKGRPSQEQDDAIFPEPSEEVSFLLISINGCAFSITEFMTPDCCSLVEGLSFPLQYKVSKNNNYKDLAHIIPNV